MHTLNMLRLADFLSAQYPATVNRSLRLTGTLLHDFAKEQEFTFSELGLVTDYSTKGQLLGHLVMGAQEVAAIAAELDLPALKTFPDIFRSAPSAPRASRILESGSLHRFSRGSPRGSSVFLPPLRRRSEFAARAAVLPAKGHAIPHLN